MVKTPGLNQPSLFSDGAPADQTPVFDIDTFAAHIDKHAPEHPYAEQTRRRLGKVMTKSEVDAVIASEGRSAAMSGSDESPMPPHGQVTDAGSVVPADAPLWQRAVMVDPADQADWERKKADLAAEEAAGVVSPTGDAFTQEHFARVNQQIIHPDNR